MYLNVAPRQAAASHSPDIERRLAEVIASLLAHCTTSDARMLNGARVERLQWQIDPGSGTGSCHEIAAHL
jgi:predicted RNA-binding Zn ribbon-like protein